MNDSMKFGPEWLRNMRAENTGSGSVGTIKMAEFRYGREEMLALFDRTVLAPDPLKSIQGLHVEKTQPPLALIQMTEEETRLWNRGVNSDAVLRSVVKPGSTGPGGPVGVGGGTRGGVSGRGGSVDRGRGRARGGFHYSRGLSYEDSDGLNNTNYSRGLRPFDRSQVASQGSSGWSERNGDTGDWSGGNMSNSPRKEYSSRSMSDTNWRRQRGSGDDDEAWRAQRHEKWGRGSSWRDGDTNWDSGHRSGSGSRAWDDGPSQSSRRQWDIEENNLPEWATENPSESGGSFDASGAFHGGGIYSDEEEEGVGRVESSRSGNTPNNKSLSPVLSTSKEEHSNITNGISPTQTERIGGSETTTTVSSSNSKKGNSGGGGGGGLRQSQSATSLSTGPSLPERKISAPSQKHNHPITTSTSLTGISTQTKSENNMKRNDSESTSQEQPPIKQTIESTNTPQPSQMVTPSPPQLIPVQESSCQQEVKCEKSEEEFDRLLEEHTDDLVNKLMEDEESASTHSVLPTSPPPTAPIQPQPPQNIVPDSDKWYYCDPQGVVQGPFHASEMAEWYKSGYFSLNLMLRRACDEKYVMLGDLVLHYGYVPFMSQLVHPPIKASDLLPQTHGLPLMSKPIDEQLVKFIRHQQLLAKLSQSEHFNSLPSVEQQQILLNQPAVPQDIPVGAPMYQPPTQPPVPQVPQLQQAHTNTPPNPVLALYHQLTSQGKAALVPPPAQPVPTPVTDPPLPVLTQSTPQLLSSQILQQFAALQGHMKPTPPPPPPPVNLQKNAEEQRKRDHLLNIIRESTSAQQNTQPTKMDSLWGGAAALPANFTPNWPQQTVLPPGQLPQSLWGELHAKGMKTEQEILDEQIRAEEERKKEELRKQEELERLKKEMEEKERKKKEEEELEQRRKKEEEVEKKRLKEEEERKKQEAAAKKAEQERLKREEEKKRKEEERKRKEEEKRRQEEEKRRLEEEQKKAEEEKKKREEEARRAEQAKKQAEALKRLQEQQQQARTVKTSTTSAWTPPETATTSLPDIQKTERKQQQQLREQQQLLQLIQQQEARNNNNNKTGASLNLKWAETKQPPARVKSLAEIQAEEQERLMKQNEREKAERIAQAKEVQLSASNSIWANQNLTWNTHNSASVWGNSAATGSGSASAGFWEDVSSVPPAKQNSKTGKQQSSGAGAANKSASGKTRAKKDEMVVMKLFEQQPKYDEFYQWCNRTLSAMQSSVDIPTFVSFLRDIESPYEVREYVRLYLGEGKDALEFASQFVERRSKVRSGETNRPENTSTTTTNSHNFQEVKGKSKKLKKGKMMRVDNKILGFSVTAAPDRINVGDRDYGEGL